MKSPFSELLSQQGVKGPQKRFGAFHYFKALQLISDAGRTGRKRIAEALSIGEGSTRTLLNELEQHGFISRNNAGVVLTPSGIKVLNAIPFRLYRLPKGTVPFTPSSCLVIVSRAGSKITNGILQRDEAVRAGGSGAISLIFTRGELLIPPDMRPFEFPKLLDMCADAGAVEGDAVIVGLGNHELQAEMAAFYAAMTLVE
jgi:predicted transcriptional regulator